MQERPVSSARRFLPAIVLTGGGGAFLAGMHPPPEVSSERVTPSVVAANASAPTAVPAPPGSAAPAVQPGPPSVAPAATGTPTAAPTVTIINPTTPPPATSVVPAAPTCLADPIAGPTISTRWGPVQVSASVSEDRTLICSIDAPVTPTDHRKSVRINDRAVPILNDSAMFTQSAVFDSISGATITSKAYKKSLQAILDGLTGG